MWSIEIATLVFGGLGLGGAVASWYLRSTLAETIIDKLDGRYMNAGTCGERHASIDRQLLMLSHQYDKLDQKVMMGFDALRSQLLATQIAQDAATRNQIRREHDATQRREELEAKG
jgi:hypothetical protein